LPLSGLVMPVLSEFGQLLQIQEGEEKVIAFGSFSLS
jgi:hypothetical protein